MVDPIVLREDDRETVVEIGDQIYFPSTLHSAITSYFFAETYRINSHLHSRSVRVGITTLLNGEKSRVLRPRKSWISGKISVKVYFEFVPDDQPTDSGAVAQDSIPRKSGDSILDDLRVIQAVSTS
ncbi:MAG TPA: hypothetical protein IGR15_09315 [Synechococcus sp. M44_DOE_062]|nr:hypothetical protein [Synechococcus sp. M44_DOE_062]